MFVMRTIAFTLGLFFTLLCTSILLSQNLMIEELFVVDSSYSSFRYGNQSIVTDNSGNIYFFYISPTETDENVIMRMSSNAGVSWTEPDTISVFIPSSASYRYLAYSPSAVIDLSGNIKVMYEYRGLPLYNSTFTEYPSSHMNYVYKYDDQWVTEVNVINDHDIQAAQGNGSTVCYLMDNQIVNYGSYQYYISYDYAWWATQYNIVYSDNTSGSWETGSPLYTYYLGAIDTRILNAPSLTVNSDSLYAIWYQSNDCQIEMKAFGGSDWTNTRVIYTDVYIPETIYNPYNVAMGTYSNESVARIAMQRVPEADFNELILLSKSTSQPWIIDTLMLNTYYGVIRPSVVGDTTLLMMINSAGENYSYLTKYLPGQGDISKDLLITSNMEDRFSNIIFADKAVNPMVYMVYDEINGKYYLKVGRLNNYLSTEELNASNRLLTLNQNYPNPAVSNTTISYSLSEKTHVTLQVYNCVGELVNTLVNDVVTPGIHNVQLNVQSLNPGMYFYSLKSVNDVKTRRMVIVN